MESEVMSLWEFIFMSVLKVALYLFKLLQSFFGTQ
jgi:hypothetical protein